MSASLETILRAAPVMPVIALDRLDQALPLAAALLEGGIPTLEVTLRTPVALEAIRQIRRAFPQAHVGAGTVTTPEALRQVADAGAAFAVSPGLTRPLLEAAAGSGLPLLPGVMTPTEVMAAMDAGFRFLKLFPAEPAGGIPMLKALAGPFRDLAFCPTGGINPATAAAYLAQPNVVCVGGSWLAPKTLMDAGDWAAVTRLAREAAALR
ncbi:bifunctional 4-hydroxy-2-oxoglutarate aldolase/2-dehydro-3-deoxy-phosphogluconate aldolase [Geothrix mesophila]|uniref:bifunctional 4-hydroxy-2-oxoglutarate aldolase/2-dehydro-3-deoxy-phosphogluconate aldolase n=1 Tax=Geothrix mesophila TaxID=2922723 RepID=UPI001FAD01D7|nr:bifunctional 4-hydroxy-2-oxoglutarate aldolase/2-dehydro-3-deoxy-phosphogluconate aldolase [Geothrix sp. SG198]